MKIFSKVLALVLALITVLTVLPMSVLADSWLDVDTEELPAGDGTHVTVTLDAKLLEELLKTEGISKDLIQKLLEAADVDRETLGKIFSLEELYGIVPREKIIEILDLKTIIEAIGLEKLNTYIDLPTLLAGCDKNELAGLLRDIPNLQNYADVERLIVEKYIAEELVLKHVKEEELKKAAESIDPATIVPEIMKLTFAEIQEIVRVYDVVADGLIDPLDVVIMDEAKKKAEELFKDPAFDINDYMEDYVDGDNAIAYFKNKYGTLSLTSLESLSDVRKLITDHYIDVKFTYHIESVNLVALIDATYMDGDVEKHFLDATDFEHKVHEYLVNKFKALTPEELHDYADAGCFAYEYDSLTDTVEILWVDIHEVLEQPGLVSIAELRANPELGVDAYLEAKVDEWIHNDDAYHKLVENSREDESKRYVTIEIDEEFEIVSVDYKKLILDKKISAEELLAADPVIVDVTGLATRLIEEEKLEVTEKLIDNALLLAEIKKIAPTTLIDYVNVEKAVQKFGTEKTIEWLGGVENAMACIDIPAVTEEILSILPTILENLNKNGVALTDVFYLDKLLPELDFQAVIEVIGVENVLAQLDSNELKELLDLMDIKSKLEPLLILFYNYGMKNVTKLTVNGTVIGEADDLALLKFDAKALVEAVRASIPTLKEIAELEGNVITSLDLEMEYVPEGTTEVVKKHLVFDFALGSGLDRVKSAAASLQLLLDSYVNELTVTTDRVVVDINVPEQFAKAYAYLLKDADISSELKEKILNVTNLNGDELIGFIEKELTLADILEVLSAVEPETVYEAVKNSELLAKVLEKLGKTVPDLTMDEVWEAIGSRKYSLEIICEAIENRTKINIRNAIKDLAPKVDNAWDRAEKIEYTNNLLKKLESKLGFRIESMTAEEYVDNEWNTDMVNTLSNFLSKRVATNVRSIIRDNTLTELWDLAIEKAEEKTDIYVKVRNYLIRALEKMPESVAACSISDLYVGNGVFSGDKYVNTSFKEIVEKALSKVVARVTIPEKAQKAIDLFMSRVDDTVVKTTVSATVRFSNLFKVTYMSADGKSELFTAFLPTGTELSVYAYKPVGDEVFLGWIDAEGNSISAMPAKDTVVYASLKGTTPPDTDVTITFKDEDGTVFGSIKIPAGSSLNTPEGLAKLAEMNAKAKPFLPEISAATKELYENFRVVWTGASATIDLDGAKGLDTEFTKDTTLVSDWGMDHIQITITFEVKDVAVLGSCKINKGSSIDSVTLANMAVLADKNLPAITENDKVLYTNFRVVWSNSDNTVYIDKEKSIGISTVFTADTTLYADRGFDHAVFFDGDVSFRNEYDEVNKVFRTIITGDYFQAQYRVGIKHILKLAQQDLSESFSYEILVQSKDAGNFCFVRMENATLRSLYKATEEEDFVWFAYEKSTERADALTGTVYQGKDMPVYSFDFTTTETGVYVDGEATVVKADFNGRSITITLPHGTAKTDSSYTTRVYTFTATNRREYTETTVSADNYVVFYATHFSDFVISDEYELTLSFYPDTASGSLADSKYRDTDGKYYLPAGTTVTLSFTMIPEGEEILKIVDQHGTVYALNGTLTMPTENIALTVTVYRHVYYVHFYYYDATLGKIMPAAPSFSYIPETDVTSLSFLPTIKDIYSAALAAAPAGYNKLSYHWTEIDTSLLYKSDISVFLVWSPISYTVTFKDTDGNVLGTIDDVTVNNYSTKYVLPALPADVVGSWTVVQIDKPADLTATTDTEITVVLRADFTAVTYPIVSDPLVSTDVPKFAVPGETVTVSAQERFGYTATFTVTTEAGDVIELADGAFTMPAAVVHINVTYVPNTVKYTVNGEERSGLYMDTVTLTIILKSNEVLSTTPTGCTLASTVKTDNETVLTYTFLLDGEKEIDYKVERVKAMIYRVFNGTLFNGVLPEPGENLKFERWSTPLYDVLYFAVFSLAQAETSMLGIWILLAVLFVLLLIVLLYVLAQHGKTLGFLSRGAIWIVELFFSLCILMAKLALKIAGLFGKSKNPNDYGFTKLSNKKSKKDKKNK